MTTLRLPIYTMGVSTANWDSTAACERRSGNYCAQYTQHSRASIHCRSGGMRYDVMAIMAHVQE